MDNQSQSQPTDPVQNDSAEFGRLPNDSEGFGNVPQGAKDFGTVRNDTEGFRNVPKVAERKESHTLTVREVARMFEASGVARTERSIINWCQPNRHGAPRLDAYFDPNERKYFITAQSVELAVKEEQAKGGKSATVPNEPVSVPKASAEKGQAVNENDERDSESVGRLKQEVMDLKITNRAKDFFIERLEKERESMIERLVTGSQRIGELETHLRQLAAPRKGDDEMTEPKREINQ